MSNEEYQQMVRKQEENTRKYEKLGLHADVLIQMYVKNPENFSAEFMMGQLVRRHAEIGFDEIKSQGDGEK